MYYIYAHRRPDNGDIFYIGRGKQYGHRARKYSRAYKIDDRNVIWNGIVNRNNGDFTVEILVECETFKDAIRLEIETIAAFGKIIDETGTLCNLTDGGEGVEGFKHSENAKIKMRAAHTRDPSRSNRFRSKEFQADRLEKIKHYPHPSLGKKASEDTKLKMSLSHKGKHGKQIINKSTGQIFNSVEEASKVVGIHIETLYKYLQGKRINYSTLRYV